MNIYYQENKLPLENNCQGLYEGYKETKFTARNGSGIYSYMFRTQEKHELKVSYPSSLYKMVFCFKGHSQTFCNNKKRYEFSEGKALFYKTHSDTYKSILEGKTDFGIMHIHLPEYIVEELKEQVPDLFMREVMQIPIPLQSYLLSSEITRQQLLHSGLSELYTEKIIMDQLFYFSEAILGRADVRLNERDRKKITDAKNILDSTDHFLTIAELSKKTSLNSFKLKKLFREELKTSVFEYQVQRQLTKAYELLFKTDLQVSEVALQCGYGSLGSFSNAFKRKFGVRPSQIKKS